MKKVRLIMMFAWAIILSCSMLKAEEKQMASSDKKVIVAYVTSWNPIIPEPQYMTHINYAFGHVTDTFNGVRIENEERLRQIVALKKQNPELKVLLSIGGWESGRFSEMAANVKFRRLFAKDCQRIVKDFGLDGIDIDWEYPTSSAANISSSPADTKNFTLLMRDIRKEIGKAKLLTLATVASANYIDFKAILPYIDFVNTMSYDMGSAPKHHSALYRSENSGNITVEESIMAHLNAGVPASRLVMGMPFYGRGGNEYPNFQDYNKVGTSDKRYTQKWDEVAKAPYLINEAGTFVFGFESPRSLAIKCQYVLDKNLLGGMYWEYSGDNVQGDMRRTLYESLIKERKGKVATRRVLVLAQRGEKQGDFSDAELQWLTQEGKDMNFEVTEINTTEPITEAFLKQFHLIIQLNYPLQAWGQEAQKAINNYTDKNYGACIGFHHEGLFQSEEFTQMFRNAIKWALDK